ncbi:response regulator transcription factor [Pseudomonas sp. UBA2684]|uniref:response regulator transcription factor n=1 Tax=Pseudomonas sp. UBA2684 TaxID=1947311 RepID=UPI000E7E26FB|nr:response regulator transcription factor [Pseudomonas sp. UBA2684]HBX57555.1 DNA-binding response regulator [Pseudomonas sp.]|tara:strand:- start:569 stop:1279 length:711 start_codon:yes stop_codon:yes gene_type:complete
MFVSHLPAARILAVEDDPLLAAHVQAHLQGSGFAVTLSHDGRQGLQLAEQEDFDLVLMDILLPGTNGLDALQQLRKRRGVPVILMSALGAEQDRIAGFSQGADDYLPKPFSLGELSVRIEAILRRVAYERRGQLPPPQDTRLQFDEGRADVRFAGQWAGLTPSEYRVLELLSRSLDEALSKPFLYQQALRRGYSVHDRSLDMHVSHIRRKLQALGETGLRLDTVWGKGYLLSREEA